MLSRDLKDKLRAYETPFYLYDMDLLRRTLTRVTGLAREHGFVVHYAIKANFDPRILYEIKESGLGIDCASGNEVRCALEAGFDPRKIVYAGVGKRDKEIRYALEQGIFAINCESVQELHVVDAIAAELGKVQDVGLRINPDIDPRTNSCIDTGQADSKFGISYEEVVSRIDEIKALRNVRVAGMHLHIGSQIRDMHVFEFLCVKANAIVARLTSLGLYFDFVDVGGGLGVNYDIPEREPVPAFESVFDIVAKHLDVGGRPVHFEFGRAIVAQCGELITSVLYNKTTATGRKYIIVDASMTELIRPALYGAYHDIENLTSSATGHDRYTIAGTACESTDVFDEGITLPVTQRGDLLTIKSAGAYGMSMASRYNLHDLPRAVYSDDIN